MKNKKKEKKPQKKGTKKEEIYKEKPATSEEQKRNTMIHLLILLLSPSSQQVASSLQSLKEVVQSAELTDYLLQYPNTIPLIALSLNLPDAENEAITLFLALSFSPAYTDSFMSQLCDTQLFSLF